MLLPVATEFDVENNTLYAETDELGTYCVLDMEVLLENFGIAPDGMQTATVEKKLYSGIGTGYNVTFIIDTRKGLITEDELQRVKDELCTFMAHSLSNGYNLGITLYTQNSTNFADECCEYVGNYKTAEALEAALDGISLTDRYGEEYVGYTYCEITEGIEKASVGSQGTNDYVFSVFAQDGTLFDIEKYNQIYKNASMTGVNISFITDKYGLNTAQTRLPDITGGIVVNNISTFADDVYNHIFEEPLVEVETFSAILATGYQQVELKGILNAYNGYDTDEDTLTDWKEVDVEHWLEVGLITYNDDNTIKLPTVEQCMKFTEVSYVESALDRLQSDYGANFGAAIGSKPVMPIESDPTEVDGDGDGWCDIDDSAPLVKNTNISDTEAQELIDILNEYLNSIMPEDGPPPTVNEKGKEIKSAGQAQHSQLVYDYYYKNIYPYVSNGNPTDEFRLSFIDWTRDVYDVKGLEAFWVNTSNLVDVLYWELADFQNTFPKALEQVFKGHYSDDITLTGTAGQIVLGFSNMDFVADLRDVTWDVNHWEWTWEHAGQTALDMACILPVIGVLKYCDEMYALRRVSNVNAIKALDNSVESINDAIKSGKKTDEIIETQKLDLIKQMNNLIQIAETDIGNIAKKYNKLLLDESLDVEQRFKCIECADDIMKYLNSQKLSGKVVDINLSKSGFTKDLPIWSNEANSIISQASQHVGIMFNGKIYDNVHINGINFEDWLADMSTFYNDGQVDLLQLYRHNIITVEFGGIT